MENESKIAIITGSTASLPKDVREAKNEGVFDVPFIIQIDGEDAFLDTPDLAEDQANLFNEMLESKEHRLSTSQPKTESYKQAFFEAEKWGATDIMLPAIVSPKLSGAVNAVNIAVGQYLEESDKKLPIWLPKRTTKVSRVEGNDVLKAIKLREQPELSPGQILDVIDTEYENCEMAQIFTNFDQLVKLGRIGRAKGMAGKLGIKAVVSLDIQEGDLVSVNASVFQSKKWESVYKVALEHIAAKFGKNAVRLAFTYYEIEQKRIDRFIELAPKYLNVANIEEPDKDKQSYVLSCYSDKATVGIFAEKA